MPLDSGDTQPQSAEEEGVPGGGVTIPGELAEDGPQTGAAPSSQPARELRGELASNDDREHSNEEIEEG